MTTHPTHHVVPPAAITELVGCTRADLSNWKRLPTDHPRYLPAVIITNPTTGRKEHWYSVEQVRHWLNNISQARYRDAVLASFAPPEAHALIATPPAMPTPTPASHATAAATFIRNGEFK